MYFDLVDGGNGEYNGTGFVEIFQTFASEGAFPFEMTSFDRV